MKILECIERTIEKYNMLSIGDHVLVGFSGGPDSTCLLYILDRLRNKYKLKISAAYIDHCLRPEETPEETDFCKKICISLGVDFFIESVDVKELAKREKLAFKRQQEY